MIESPRDEHNPRPIEVLVVDDQREITELVTETLCDEGYAVRVAYDGASALRAISARRPALLLLDVAMPVLTGDQVLQQLRGGDFEDLPVILMTADRAPERYTALRPNRLLRKPFDLDQMLRMVAECLSQACAHQQFSAAHQPRMRELGA